MNIIKNKLIELLGKRYNSINREQCLVEQAEELINNDVTIPPCKLGSKVFFVNAELLEIRSATVVGIYYNYYTPSMPIWVDIEYTIPYADSVYRDRISAEVFPLVCKKTENEALEQLDSYKENKEE